MSANTWRDEFIIRDDVASLLDGMVEPIALVSLNGVVRYQNRAFRQLCGVVIGHPLSDLEKGDKSRLEVFLRRSSGTTAALLGTMQLSEDLSSRHRALARRVQLEGGSAILVQLDVQAERRFADLSRQVDDLNQEVARRRQAEAVLKESVSEREMLVRELQHRVKNNMQMLESMLRRAERETETVEAKAAIKEVSGKVRAVAAVQRLLYTSENLTTISSAALAEAVIASVSSLAPPDVSWYPDCDAFPIAVSTATTVALILNELLTNAVKHGRCTGCNPIISVKLQKQEASVRLLVADNGPGFEYRERVGNASGLGLVRGLVRQIGGTMTVEQNNGAQISVCFVDDNS